MIRLSVITYILIFSIFLSAQVNTIEELTGKYASFDYREVIKLAEDMIKSQTYSSDSLIQIYELKGMAYYSLGEENNAKKAFDELLEINPNHSMDPTRISPKIISFFNEIKVAYQNELDEERPLLDSLKIIRQEMINSQSEYKTAIVKNLVVPGWGHFQIGNTAKGIIYSTLSVASVASSIAFIIKTNNARTAYQNETVANLIEAKYDEYNSAYKTRNLFLITTALVWAASQIDLFFFEEFNSTIAGNRVNSQFQIPQELQLSITIPLN